MTDLRNRTQVFILRIWQEPREIEGKQAEWRGVIEHIATGTRYFFNDLSELDFYILPYLEEMNVRIDRHSRLCYWLIKWKRTANNRNQPSDAEESSR